MLSQMLMLGDNSPRWQPECCVSLYRAASQGMLPISWESMGFRVGEDTFYAGLLEALAVDQWRDHVRFEDAHKQYLDLQHQLAGGNDGRPYLALTGDEIVVLLESNMDVRRGIRQAMLERREHAHHFGMILCRAFFNMDVVAAASEWSHRVGYMPEIMGMIEEFVNG